MKSHKSNNLKFFLPIINLDLQSLYLESFSTIVKSVFGQIKAISCQLCIKAAGLLWVVSTTVMKG